MTFKMDGYVPLLGWNFDEEGLEIYNEENWEGWDSSWTVIGTNGMGDPFVLNKEGQLCEVQHGEAPRATVTSENPDAIHKLVSTLQKLGEPDDLEDLSRKELESRLGVLKEIAPLVPETWEEMFEDCIQEIEDALEDLDFEEAE